MKRLLIFINVAIILATGCKVDNSALENRIDNLESRVAKLEQLCAEMNTNISSLQTIVNALKDNDYIKSVSPVVTKEGEEIGYKISFGKNGDIIIYHGNDGKDGADGKDGHTPVIGVSKDKDGVYYWTLDGEWLKDADGNKIRAEGQNSGSDTGDGKDGVTPRLKIEDDYWYVSYDNGDTWERLGKAVSEGGDSFFKDVIVSEDEIKFILDDGTELVVPRKSELSVKFSVDSTCTVTPLSNYDIDFEIISNSETIEVEMLSSMDLTASLKMKDNKHGRIHVTFGDVVGDNSKIILLVSDGSRVIMKSVNFETAGITVSGDSVQTVPAEGGKVTFRFYTNVNYTCEISPDAQSWIELPAGTKAMELKEITFSVKQNDGAEREGKVTVSSEDGNIKVTFIVRQEGDGSSDNFFTKLKNIGFYKFSGETVTDKIEYVRFESQYLVTDPMDKIISFALFSPKNKYLFVDKIPTDLEVGEETTFLIKQNYSSVKADKFQLTCKLIKKSYDTLWFFNESLSEGIILKMK